MFIFTQVHLRASSSPVTLELCSWKRGYPSQPQGEGSHEGPPSGARTLYSCSATRCGLVRASPSPHWGCPQLQGAFQPQKSPPECLPFRKQPSSFLGTSKNLVGKQSVPGGGAEGGLAQGPLSTPSRQSAEQRLRSDSEMLASNLGGGMMGGTSVLDFCVVPRLSPMNKVCPFLN